MKKILVVILSILLLTGCSSESKNQVDKSEYLSYKSNLISGDIEYTEDLICDIDISVSRIDSETVSYITTVKNAKENMNNIKMLVVHNYFTEELFPSVGIFDDVRSISADGSESIILSGFIDTNKDISKLNLEVKVWIEYTDDNGEVKDIYYKTTK